MTDVACSALACARRSRRQWACARWAANAADRYGDRATLGTAELLVGVVLRRLPAGAGLEPGGGAVRRADVGVRAGPDQPVQDRGRAEHDDAQPAGDRRLRSGVPAPVRGVARPDQCGAGGPDRRGEDWRPDQLRDVTPGHLPGRPAVRVARRPRAEADARPAGCAHQPADGGGHPGSRGAAEGGGGVPPRACRRVGERDDRGGGRAEHDRLRARSHPRDLHGAGAGRRRDADAHARRDPAQRPVVHRSEPARPTARSRADRTGQLHLDQVSAQALRGRGHERVPVGPRDAARALPPGSARSCSWRRDDLDDREPLGASGTAALQPALPVGVRVLAQRAPAPDEDGPTPARRGSGA